jgi:hypothetical protein
MPTNVELAATVASLQERLDDIDRQLKHLFKLHGPATWEHFERQRIENVKNEAERRQWTR